MIFSSKASGKASTIFSSTAIDNTSEKPVFVIVHGAWGGSWAFRHVAALLEQKGNTVYRPSLTGQGERVHLATPDVSLSTHINDVVNMLLYENLRDVILVGYSYGGMVVTGAADCVPERIRRIVYLDAFVPEDGESVTDIWSNRRDWLDPMIKDGFLVPPWLIADQTPPSDVRQSLKTFTEKIVLNNPMARAIPADYILAVEADQDAKNTHFSRMAERAKVRRWPVEQITSDHNVQSSAPEALVEMLNRYR